MVVAQVAVLAHTMSVVCSILVWAFISKLLPSHHVVAILAHSLGIKGFWSMRALCNDFFSTTWRGSLLWLLLSCLNAAFSLPLWELLARAASFRFWLSELICFFLNLIISHNLVFFIIGGGCNTWNVLNTWHILKLIINLSPWVLWLGIWLFLYGLWLLTATPKSYTLLNDGSFTFWRVQFLIYHKMVELPQASLVACENVIMTFASFHILKSSLNQTSRVGSWTLYLFNNLLTEGLLIILTR